jgi:hypothetical protein
VSLRGGFLCTQAVLPALKEHGGSVYRASRPKTGAGCLAERITAVPRRA